MLESKKGAKIRRDKIIVWNQDDKIIQRGNNRGTRKTLALLWENHFTGYYLQENFCDWLYGEDSERFRAGGSLSQCLKKDICDVWEIREDAASLSQTQLSWESILLCYFQRRNQPRRRLVSVELDVLC